MARACELAGAGELEALRALGASALHEADKYGSLAVHWAAGGGHLETLEWLLGAEVGMDADSEGSACSRSKRRRPLHYAARN